jgi:hypothetical protein
MSIKKLFDQQAVGRKYVSDTDQKDAFDDIESADNLEQLYLKQTTYVPQVDYSDPQAFAKFGSAYLYYKSAIERVLDFYPYDGSSAEKNEFYNKSLDIEKYIFNKRYPRTTGYVTLCSGASGWGSLHASGIIRGGYGLPQDKEYITFHGGPNVSSNNKTLQEMMPDPNSSKFQNNNIYDTNIYTNDGKPSDYGTGTRESNLRTNFDSGVTVEFWLQTGSLDTAITQKQVIFDLWNNEASSSADYGRITVELTGASGYTRNSSPFFITAQSGAASASAQSIFTSSIGTGAPELWSGMGSWNHYAISMYNSGSDFIAKLYVNGALNHKKIYDGININEIQSKKLTGRLGALLTAPSGTTDTSVAFKYSGAGKLSGSLDEFRFWKTARDARQIGTNWFAQVGGGANSDLSNTTLGMYYKFNEGITGDTGTDSVVLDYAGRLCNGTWQGYNVNSRNTGSAIMSASAALREYEEPIIYAHHPKVAELKGELTGLGRYHDGTNTAVFKNLMPTWVLEQADNIENSNIDILCHIAGTYFDKLHAQISALQTLKHLNYTSASASPIPFAQNLPQSLGLYTPEIFVDSTVLEKFTNRNEKELFENDLHEVKNLIYSNIYNNLAHIYKAKGTERAIRNVFRCFNLDDSLVTYSVYANNQTYELKNNLKQTLKDKKFANFNNQYNNEAVIYQSADPSQVESRGFISGSGDLGYEDKYGMTAEASINFPRFFRGLDRFDRNFKEVSLWGMYTVNSSSVENTTLLTSSQDYANFQVFAVRDEPYSDNVYFKITSSNTPYYFPTLTSSTFLGVYENNDWNLSVRLKPSKYPYVDVLTGSDNYTYDIIFRGVNNNLGTIANSFELSSSITKEVGNNILRSAKRMYVGAHKTNITGATLQKSDIKVSTAKYWTKFLDNDTINQHAVDRENFGISGSFRNVSALDSNLANVDAYNINTLALNWYFGNVTSSDSSGNFYVSDISSGSAMMRDNFGWVGKTSGYLHTGKGYGFDSESTDVVKKEMVNEFKFIDPERVVGSDMVKIIESMDRINELGTPDQVPNYIFTIEKSLYASVSEEILDFFAGVLDFQNLIGQPVNRYRERYKSMEGLRRIFFSRFGDITRVEKFTEYYKWFDDSIALIVEQLVPASADFVPDTFNLIESHVLERPKYQTKYPTLEFKTPEPTATLKGIVAQVTPWWVGGPVDPGAIGPGILGDTDGADLGDHHTTPFPIAAPLPLSTPIEGPFITVEPTKIHTDYWRHRSLPKTTSENSSDSGIVDGIRRTFQEQGWSKHVVSQSMPILSTPAGHQYHRNHWIDSQLHGVYRYNNRITKPIHAGVNFTSKKDLSFIYSSVFPAGPVNTDNGVFVPENVLFGPSSDLIQLQELEMEDSVHKRLNKKVKRNIKVQHGRNWEDGIGYYNLKSSNSFPFNIFSSSVISGFNKEVVERLTASVELSNLHNDVYGPDLEKPMQTTFSSLYAGGHQSRHVPLNTSGSGKIYGDYNGLDDYTTRPEAWKILLGTCGLNPSGAIGVVGPDYPWPEANEVGETPYPMTASQKAVYYRDRLVKTPYVFRNILETTSSRGTILGNYRINYQVVHSVGSTGNPRQFIETQPVLPPQTFQSGAAHTTQVRTFLDIHRDADNHKPFVDEYSVDYLTGTINKTIIRSKFSNPGGLEVSPFGYTNFRADEFSVYNSPSYRNLTVLKPSQGPRGTFSEITGVGGPGIRVTDIHTMDYGLRSHLSRHTAKFGRDSLYFAPDDYRKYDLTIPIIGYGDKKVYRMNETLQAWWRLNEDVTLTTSASVVDSSGRGRPGTFLQDSDRPAFSTTLYPSRYVQTGSCTFDATTDRSVIGSAATWDAIIGNNTAGGSTQKMTFAAWAYPTGPGEGSAGRIIDFGSGDISLRIDANYAVHFQVKWGPTPTTVRWKTGDGAISINDWAHIIVAYDANSTANVPVFYINGAEVASTLTAGSTSGTYYGIVSQRAYIGNNSNDDRTWQGQLADVAVWNDILIQEDVSAIYNASKIPENGHGPGASYEQLPGYHKVHRNNRRRLRLNTRQTGFDIPNYNTGAVNEHIMLFANTDGGAIAAKDLKLYHSGNFQKNGSNITTKTWTMVMWFNKLTDNSNSKALMTIGDNGASVANQCALKWQIYGGNSYMQLTSKNSSNVGKWKGSTQLSDDNWYHLAVTFDGSSLNNDPIFYVDGVADTTTEETTPQAAMDAVNDVAAGRSLIGGGGTTTNMLPWRNAAMAEVAIYDAVLNANEIVQIYNGGSLLNLTHSAIAPKVDNLVSWLRMGDTKGVAGNAALSDLSASNTALSRSCKSSNASVGQPHTVYDVMGNNHYALWGNVSNATNDASSSFYSITSDHPNFFTGTYSAIEGDPVPWERSTYTMGSDYDNFYVQHQIPRSSRQYAWITSSIIDASDFRFYGYSPTKGIHTGMYSSSIDGLVPYFNHVSASNWGSFVQAGNRSWGTPQSNAGVVQFFPTPFMNLNLNVAEPITSQSTIAPNNPYKNPQNTMGYPAGTALLDSTGIPTQYRNTSFVPGVESAASVPQRESTVFNALMLKRNNVYGWGAHSRNRQHDHPILQTEVKANRISAIQADNSLTSYALRPISLKGRPSYVNMETTDSSIIRAKLEIARTNATLGATYNNEFIYFSHEELDDLTNIEPVLRNQITPFEQVLALRHLDGYKLNWVDYTECVYPSLRNEFWSGSSYRMGFDNKYWRDSFADRVHMGTFELSTSLGNPVAGSEYLMGSSLYWPGISQSSWPLDAPQDFLTRTRPPVMKHSPSGLGPAYAVPWGFSLRKGISSEDDITFPFGFANPGSGAAGELQNTFGWTHFESDRGSIYNTLGAWGEGTQLLVGLVPGALYARKHMLDNPRSMNSPNQPNLYLRDTLDDTANTAPQMDVFNDVLDFEPKTSPTLANNNVNAAATGSGEALWEAGATAGYFKTVYADTGNTKTLQFVSHSSEPWWNDYDNFKADLKLKARGYSVVPEFRISERVEQYLAHGLSATGDFRTFDIPHTEYNSTRKDFYTDFSNSDFMKHFLQVKNMSGMLPKELKITARAAIRFNPYKGFYPAQRTLDMVTQFSKSYGASFDLTSPYETISTPSGSWTPDRAKNIVSRFIYQPMFAPGILYNSIKSGIACDWPLMRTQQKIQACLYTGSFGGTVGNCESWAWYPQREGTPTNSMTAGTGPDMFMTGTLWDQRIPFEAIIDPGNNLAKATFVDMESHPSAALGNIVDVSASFGGVGDPLYTLMASNFCAEVAQFFLKGKSYTTLAGRGLLDGKAKFSNGSVFGARLRMRTSHSGSRTYEYESGSSGDNKWFSKFGARAYRCDLYGGGSDHNSIFESDSPAGYGADPGITGKFEIPQDPKQNPYYKQNFIMYNRTTAFGPSFSNRYPARYGKSGELSGESDLVNYSDFPNNKSYAYYDKPHTYMSMSVSGVMDCFNGYNWGWTPPYYHGEAWCDFIFRPSGGVEYDIEKILSEIQIRQWRADPGPRTGSEDTNAGRYDRTLWRDSLRPYGKNADVRLQNISPYNSYNINHNAMQLSHSLNLFGVQPIYKKTVDKFGKTTLSVNEVVGKSWAIQPKFETPMMNFSDTGIRPITGNTSTKTLPQNFGAETTPSGMWHQFGTLPESPDHGIFLEIGDIPNSWLRSHYSVVSESSIYNGFNSSAGKPTPGAQPTFDGGYGSWTTGLETTMKSLSNLMGFDETNSKVRLGEVSERKVVREAIVVVPYIENYLVQKTGEFIFDKGDTDVVDVTEVPEVFTTIPGMSFKNFINIPLARFHAALETSDGTPSGDDLDAAGISIRRLMEKMDKYVLPPQFDFINNPAVSPVVMYMLEFEYEFDKDDLSYMWQNIAPRNYKRMSFQKDCISHSLMNTELLSANNLFENPNLRWMVFKVKQKSQAMYGDKIISQVNQSAQTPFQFTSELEMKQTQEIPVMQKIKDQFENMKSGNRKEQEPTYPLKYNWPYDYFSFVELVKVEAEILFSDKMSEVYSDESADTKLQVIRKQLEGNPSTEYDKSFDAQKEKLEKLKIQAKKDMYAAVLAEDEKAKLQNSIDSKKANEGKNKMMKKNAKAKIAQLAKKNQNSGKTGKVKVQKGNKNKKGNKY